MLKKQTDPFGHGEYMYIATHYEVNLMCENVHKIKDIDETILKGIKGDYSFFFGGSLDQEGLGLAIAATNNVGSGWGGYIDVIDRLGYPSFYNPIRSTSNLFYNINNAVPEGADGRHILSGSIYSAYQDFIGLTKQYLEGYFVLRIDDLFK